MLAFVVVTTAVATVTNSVAAPWDHVESFDSGWLFHLGDAAGAEKPQYDDSQWRPVDLPHDWSIELGHDRETPDGNQVGYLRGGIGWYRKKFTLPANSGEQAVEAIFDGVQQESEVWINGHYLGLQPNGYIAFVRQLTTHLAPSGQPNVLAVRAINPEQNTRWYAGSGIYRQVKLRMRPKFAIATWGVQIDTLWIKDSAKLQIRVTVRNDSAVSEAAELVMRLHRPDGSVEPFAIGQVRVAPGTAETVGQEITVKAPQAWSPEQPTLYLAELFLMHGDREVAVTRQPFGIRTVKVSADQGFLLSGKPLKLKGACLHHDNGLIGAATFEAAEERRVRLMRENGFNTIRTSHNPPSSVFLDACDRLGMLVINEFVDMWELPKKPNGYNRYFAGHWEQDLSALIQRDYNHPAVVIWSIGNEIPERARPTGIEIGRKMVACIRNTDRLRPITNGICEFWDNPDQQWDDTAPAFALLDIGGYNYQDGRYEGDHAAFPQRVILGTESFPNRIYPVWQSVEKHPYVIGDCVWTGMDHIGESGLGHTTYVDAGTISKQPPLFMTPFPTWLNWSGDIDITGNKKPQSYYRDVVWDRSQVELAVHGPVPPGKEEWVGAWGWPDELQSWNWPGLEGQALTVRVFSKAAKVRLELNGRVVGEKSPALAKDVAVSFDVPFRAGELKATALAADGAVLGSRSLVTSGDVAAIVAAAEAAHARAIQSQLVYVPLELRDANGALCTKSELPVSVTIDGPAEVLAFGSANPSTARSLREPQTTTFRGRALLILRSTGQPGAVRVKFSVPGVQSSETRFDLR